RPGVASLSHSLILSFLHPLSPLPWQGLRCRRITASLSSLHVRTLFPRPVRHFVYCVRIEFGHSQTCRPARDASNAGVAPCGV
ncbi:MAG: hypothetical protein J5704_04770, partial [Paludibacteraceae bacterium]|nr:hypothetical protein [Paludibacteraceae bacterium]